MFARRWLAVAALVILAGCGDDLALARAYVMKSPRRTVAVMPLSLAPGQKDVISLGESTLRAALTDRGFIVVGGRGPDRSAPVFGPRTDAPRVEDVQAFGRAARAPVVLVARIESASEGRSAQLGVLKNRTRVVVDARGRRTRVVEKVAVSPDRPAVAPLFRLDARLIETDSGQAIWSKSLRNNVPEWTLRDLVIFSCRSAADQLAETYYDLKL